MYVNKKNRSHRLKLAIDEVNDMVKRNIHLSYPQARRLLGGVSGNEREFLIDYIVSSYGMCDIDALLSYYDSLDDMFIAMKSTSGSEYDIKELYYSGSDAVYDEMVRHVVEGMGIIPARSVVTKTVDEKFQIANALRKHTSATMVQISKFLHLSLKVGAT